MCKLLCKETILTHSSFGLNYALHMRSIRNSAAAAAFVCMYLCTSSQPASQPKAVHPGVVLRKVCLMRGKHIGNGIPYHSKQKRCSKCLSSAVLMQKKKIGTLTNVFDYLICFRLHAHMGTQHAFGWQQPNWIRSVYKLTAFFVWNIDRNVFRQRPAAAAAQ